MVGISLSKVRSMQHSLGTTSPSTSRICMYLELRSSFWPRYTRECQKKYTARGIVCTCLGRSSIGPALREAADIGRLDARIQSKMLGLFPVRLDDISNGSIEWFSYHPHHQIEQPTPAWVSMLLGMEALDLN